MRQSDSGVLTKRQLRVLELRSKGNSQAETARELGTTRANVSMIEFRAKKKIQKAKQAIQAYESMLRDFKIEIKQGTRVAEIPAKVLHACDRREIHLQGSIVEILKAVKSVKPECMENGKTNRTITLRVDGDGTLYSE